MFDTKRITDAVYFSGRMALRWLFTLLFFASCIWGCGGKAKTMVSSAPAPASPTVEDPASLGIENLYIPQGFDFATTQEVELQISVLDGLGQPVSGIRLDVLKKEAPDLSVVFTGATDEKGMMASKVNLPAYVTELELRIQSIGFPQEITIPIEGGRAQYTYGDVGPVRSGKILAQVSGSVTRTLGANGYYLLGSWNNLGVPDYLVGRDAIDSGLIERINASLPEKRPVPTYHPDYLTNKALTLKLKEDAEVWVTFVHEGAGWKNALGYYSHPLNSPPTGDIDETIIFPNASYRYSGGGLRSGDKVYLGSFEANTEIGWSLLAQGWTNGGVKNQYYTVYSNPDLNPESDPALRQHNVLLRDDERSLLLLAFEDIRRDNAECDNDFNDAVFYVTVSPYSAVILDDVALVDDAVDSDNDLISDIYDDFPNDPNRAFINYYPSENAYGTLAFEDLWPNKGDYDFNDLVVDYNFKQISDARNRVIDIESTFRVNAAGAAYRNGFGFQLPFDPSHVSQVEGQQINHYYIAQNANGTEAGQTKATVIVFDDAQMLMPPPSGYFVNTQTNAPYVDPVEIKVVTTLSTAWTMTSAPPYNPFVISNGERGRELHLPGAAPTDLVDQGKFGSGDDKSLSAGYYRTASNLPWALHLASEWKHPRERVEIVDAYASFAAWAESGGTVNVDWYVSANANTQYIYSR